MPKRYGLFRFDVKGPNVTQGADYVKRICRFLTGRGEATGLDAEAGYS